MRLDQSAWTHPPVEAADQFRFEFPLCQDPSGLSIYIEGHVAPPAEAGWPPEVIHRLYCYLLVSQLPDEAVGETVEELMDLYQFYARPVRKLPAPRESEPVPVRIGTTKIRPVFPVPDED